MEGFPPCWRDAERDIARADSPTFSDASEHTDWMSEMSKSEASLPLRLLPLLPALLPGRLEFFCVSRSENTKQYKRPSKHKRNTNRKISVKCLFNEMF